MRNTFDSVAAIYPLLEWLSYGNELARARRAFFEQVVSARNILLVGEGNGRFLQECLLHAPQSSITVVDLSSRMLASARRSASRSAASAGLKLIHADFLSWRGRPGTFDLIVTHFFLDLFSPLNQRRVIENIGLSAAPSACWIDVDYRCPRARRRDRIIDWLQYRFDNAFCGVEADRHHDPSAAIGAAGWHVQGEQLFSAGNVAARLHGREIAGAAPRGPASG